MVRVNLLPIREILRKRELKHFMLLGAIIVAATLVFMACFALYFSWKIAALEKDKKVHEIKLKQLKEKNKKIEELKNRIAQRQRQVDTMERLIKTRDTSAPFLAAVSVAIPDEVWLNSITKTGRNFALDGVGVDNTVVVNFVQRLQSLKQGFTLKQPWVNASVPTDKSFFTNVKLLQIVATGGASGLGTMSFKIVGNLR
jgi:type IV pilus assembly protein PilN